MKFPRSATILRSQLDAAPFASVLLAFLIFLLLAMLMPVPGIPLALPAAADLPGVAGPTVNLAVDSQGRLFYQNQMVSEESLKTALAAVAAGAAVKPTLVIHADKAVTYDQLVHLALLARAAGLTNSLLATLPRLSDVPRQP